MKSNFALQPVGFAASLIWLLFPSWSIRVSVIIKGEPKIDPLLTRETVLWRYLDAAKFLHLLESKTLFLARGDQFEDRFEGTFTKSIRHAIEKAYEGTKTNFTFEQFATRLRERVFVQCWHASSDDSMAMWSLYGRSDCSVAVTTTVGRLTEALRAAKLQHSISISKVQYVKHWRDPEMNIKPYSNVFAYKVKAYEYEKEVRVIMDRFHEDFEMAPVETGIVVPVALKALIRSIVVSPEAPAWFYSLVERLCLLLGSSAPVRRSKLAFSPK